MVEYLYMNPKKIFKNLGNLTTPFGGQTRGESKHPGLDIANKEGTPIPALSDGTITTVGETSNGFGNIVALKDKEGNVHQYGHLQKSVVKPGMKVRKGQTIGKMGHSGNSYSESGGPSDHLDIRVATPNGSWKNPMELNK